MPEMAPEFREWVIDFGHSGYVVVYRFDGQQACQDAVFFRVMTAYRKPRGFFAAQNYLVLIYQFADELESDWRLVKCNASVFCHAIDEV